MTGGKGYTYEDDEMGITVVGNEIIVDRAEAFDLRGLFNIGVDIHQLPNRNLMGSLMDCFVKVEEKTLKSSLDTDDFTDFMDDEEFIELMSMGWKPAEDPELKYYHYAGPQWWMDGKLFRLFLPADQDALSKLRFHVAPILTKESFKIG